MKWLLFSSAAMLMTVLAASGCCRGSCASPYGAPGYGAPSYGTPGYGAPAYGTAPYGAGYGYNAAAPTGAYAAGSAAPYGAGFGANSSYATPASYAAPATAGPTYGTASTAQVGSLGGPGTSGVGF